MDGYLKFSALCMLIFLTTDINASFGPLVTVKKVTNKTTRSIWFVKKAPGFNGQESAVLIRKNETKRINGNRGEWIPPIENHLGGFALNGSMYCFDAKKKDPTRFYLQADCFTARLINSSYEITYYRRIGNPYGESNTINTTNTKETMIEVDLELQDDSKTKIPNGELAITFIIKNPQ